MNIPIIICGTFLTIAAILVLYRVTRGPSSLDRMVSLDVLTAIVIGSVTLITAATKRTDLLPVLIVLALVGFIASATVSRFATGAHKVDNKRLDKDRVDALLEAESRKSKEVRDDR